MPEHRYKGLRSAPPRPRPRGASALIACLLVSVTFGALARVDSALAAPTIYPNGVTLHDPSKAFQGLNLFIDTQRSRPNGEIVLMDMSGADVQTWSSPIVGFEKIQLVEPLPSGNILAVLGGEGAGAATIVEMDWNGTPVWQFTAPPDVKLHHDYQRLENGHTLLLGRRAGIFPEIGPNPIGDDILLEVDALGNIVWEWSTAAHWDSLPLSVLERNLIALDNLNSKANIFHTNSVAVLPPNPYQAQDARFAPGNILISQRDTNIVILLERATGDIIWFTKQALGQHQVHMIEPGLPGAGSILLLDNGGQAGYPLVPRLWSQVLELNPVTSGVLWQYDATDSGLRQIAFFGPFKGGAERMPNGNTVIVEGSWGRVFEVTPSGEIVWEYVRPGGELYRMSRVGPGWPPVVGRDLPTPSDRSTDDR